VQPNVPRGTRKWSPARDSVARGLPAVGSGSRVSARRLGDLVRDSGTEAVRPDEAAAATSRDPGRCRLARASTSDSRVTRLSLIDPEELRVLLPCRRSGAAGRRGGSRPTGQEPSSTACPKRARSRTSSRRTARRRYPTRHQSPERATQASSHTIGRNVPRGTSSAQGAQQGVPMGRRTTYAHDLCARPMRTTYAHDLCARPMRMTYAHDLCARPMRTTYAHDLCARPMRTTYAHDLCA